MDNIRIKKEIREKKEENDKKIDEEEKRKIRRKKPYYIKIDNSLFYDIQPSLSRFSNTDIIMSVGGRGIGKTFGWKYEFLRNYIEHGRTFVYLRRYDSELDTIEELFEDMFVYFPGFKYKYQKHKIYVQFPDSEEWERIGYFYAMSRAKNFKGSPFPSVDYILLDEFQICDEDKRANRYLTGEVKTLFQIYETIARLRPVKLILLSNAESLNNPYFAAFDVDITHLKEGFTRGKKNRMRYCIEIVPPCEISEQKMDSVSGRLMSAIGLDRSMISNKFDDDTNIRLKQRPEKSTLVFNVLYNDKIYGCWKDSENYYFNNQSDINRETFVCSMDEMDENTIYVKRYGDFLYFKICKYLLAHNRLFYNNKKTKFAIENFFLEIGAI